MRLVLQSISFTFIFLLNVLVIAAESFTCSVSNSSKTDCGYAGITENVCLSTGCCWNPVGQNSVNPWCFYPQSIPTTETCSIADWTKRDCGYAGINENSCAAKGCCWVPAGQNSATPWCFYPGAPSDGYTLQTINSSENGYIGTLVKLNPTFDNYGTDTKYLTLYVIFETSDIIRIKILESGVNRWEIPSSVINLKDSISVPSTLNYVFSYTENPFTFTITRKSDNTIIFKSIPALVFKDQYLEVTTSVFSNSHIYGLGESARTNHALSRNRVYTLWGADIPAASMNMNLYGSYPFFLQLVNGAASGVAMMNSNGMDVLLSDTALTYKMLGGVIDLFILSGPTPAAVVSQLTAVVGAPALVPYWSLGFHNCKYGYTSLSQVEQVVAGYAEAQIPLDTQWVDIDYMQNYRDFTTDSVNFPTEDVANFVNELHKGGQHFVPIIDPGIMVYPNNGYDAYDRGLKEGLFVTDLSGNFYLGQVWPGPTYFPDFFNPRTQSYWTDQLKEFHNAVPVDGLWIDMNEVSNFCNNGYGQHCINSASGGCPAPGGSQTTCCLVCTTVDSSNTLDFPPYSIDNAKGLLSVKTMAMSAKHYGNITVYDAHNLYGLTEQIATKVAMEDIRGKRSFVLSRSGFLSTGAHSAKWTGDNAATWSDLKASIVGVLDLGLFGVPMSGADICGFLGDTTEELCARWIEVGAFYPFSRDHNTLGAAPQELYLWPSVAEASRTALGLRYKLLPYIYTLFAKASFEGATVARALWFNFPADQACVGLDEQFMIGSAVLLSPVLDQGSTSVSAYFPQGYWYSLFSLDFSINASSAGFFATIPTPLTATNAHLFGGNIVPMQESAMTTTSSRQTPFTLVAGLSVAGTADGSLYWDDGEQIKLSDYLAVTYTCSYSYSTFAGKFEANIVSNAYADASTYALNTVVILGPSLNTISSAQMFTSAGAVTIPSTSIKCETNRLTFSGLDLTINMKFSITW